MGAPPFTLFESPYDPISCFPSFNICHNLFHIPAIQVLTQGLVIFLMFSYYLFLHNICHSLQVLLSLSIASVNSLHSFWSFIIIIWKLSQASWNSPILHSPCWARKDWEHKHLIIITWVHTVAVGWYGRFRDKKHSLCPQEVKIQADEAAWYHLAGPSVSPLGMESTAENAEFGCHPNCHIYLSNVSWGVVWVLNKCYSPVSIFWWPSRIAEMMGAW